MRSDRREFAVFADDCETVPGQQNGKRPRQEEDIDRQRVLSEIAEPQEAYQAQIHPIKKDKGREPNTDRSAPLEHPEPLNPQFRTVAERVDRLKKMIDTSESVKNDSEVLLRNATNRYEVEVRKNVKR